jgi:hypothetical protein
MLAVNANASFKNNGMLLLSKTGMVIKMAPIRKKIKKNSWSWAKEIFREIIF